MRMKGVYGKGRFTLGPFYMSDIKKIVKLAGEYPLSLEDGLGDPTEFFHVLAKSKDALLMTGRDGKKVGGYITFNLIHPGRDVFFGGYAYRGNHEGVVACSRLACRYAVDTWNVLRITAMHSVKNRSATLADLRTGFKKEGILRHAMLFGGEPHDVQVLSVLREEVKKWQLELQ